GLLDGFERRHGLSVDSPDTDGDGLLDPAEDLDHDGLSNLGEQTLGTNPLVRDSDGDGISDGEDDANGDGTADWEEQDHRRVPEPLAPPATDPARNNRCYVPRVGSTGKCVGDPSGKTQIAIYGDSHSGQWLPALNRYAKEHHWRLSGATKSG